MVDVLADEPRLVADWTEAQLGVHAAVAGSAREVELGRFVVPTYVERDHDAGLRRRMDSALAEAQAALLILRGGSCTGKTRTAVEAIRVRLPDWVLIFPKTQESLLSVLAAQAAGPRTVLWLDEAQEYLSSEVVAAALRTYLEQPGPAFVVMTLWPERYGEIFAQGGHVGKLLASSRPVDIPRSFSGRDMRVLRKTAKHDRSLDAVLKASMRDDVTQTLAAGPALVDHYEQAASPSQRYGRAIIDAAMDAARLGDVRVVSAAFLKQAAPGYLSDSERKEADPDWFDQALIYARTKIRGVASPLSNVAVPGAMGSTPDAYQLADYLDSYGRLTRRGDFPPNSFWEAVENNVVVARELERFGWSAKSGRRFKLASLAFHCAFDLGSTSSLSGLAWLRQEMGDLEDAEALHWRLAEAGSLMALEDLAYLREQAGDYESAEELALLSAGKGLVQPLASLMWSRLSDPDEAERIARLSLEAKDTHPVVELAAVLHHRGDTSGARRLYEAGAEAGNPFALRALSVMRFNEGDVQEAERFAIAAAESGFPQTLTEFAEIVERLGERDKALDLARYAVEIGREPEVAGLAWMLHRIGHEDEALEAARRVIDSSDSAALLFPAWRLKASWSGAEDLCEQAARNGNAGALIGLVHEWRRVATHAGLTGLESVAIEWENVEALAFLADVSEAAGDVENAEALLRRAVSLGHATSCLHLAEMFQEMGDMAGAEKVLLEGIAMGDGLCFRELSKIWAAMGREEASRLLPNSGLEADGQLAAPSWKQDHRQRWTW
ncbi:hypothetical protein GCM10009839_23540 [Catenulispora yoronensis]|uniref:Uncharacterized protein n=2 Tax=Catenulispora yoronensis TaxID=450799 RepID=A0ABP5FEA0_9ACTN